MDKGKVVVGMSGGVDSSVAAYLLKEQGYEVIGVTMQMWHDDELNADPSKEIDDAGKVAKFLQIPHYVLNFETEFRQKVMEYFADEYIHGRTPNPCVICNRYVKWEALLERSREFGADLVATGHYAKVVQRPNGRFAVEKVPTGKDQTYALYNLTQDQLSRTLMPVGEYEKDEIRELAAKIGLSVAEKPDSMDICFVPDDDYAGAIERISGKKVPGPGNFVTKDGTILGKHKGITHYTIGQRKGLNLAMGHPVFVTEIRPETNEVVVGENEDIFRTTLLANKVNFMGIPPLEIGETIALNGKIRYAHKGDACQVKRVAEDEIECTFETPQRAITPGQALVCYDGEDVALGGIIM